jgi:chlorosome envelope protein X
LLDTARAHHSHIGYFCGGNAICQTCYVRVLEGHELLSPMSEAEKAMLSDTLIKEGTRMACQTIIEKPGTIRILTEVEAAKRITESTPVQLPAYMGKMGWASAEKFTDTIAFQARREQAGHPIEPAELFYDVLAAIGDAVQLVIDAVQSALGMKRSSEKPAASASDSKFCCDATDIGKTTTCLNGHGRAVSPEILRRHQESVVSCN